MISIDRLKEMALEDIENNPEKHLEEYTELLQQLDQLKAENIKFTLDSKKLVTQYSAKLERLKQTLNEIKEIAEDIEDLFYEGLETGTTYDRVITLLQKISEVEDETTTH